MRRTGCIAALLAALAIGAAPASAAVQLTSIGTFAAPIFVTAPPGDGARVFVVERGGTIQVIDGGVRKQFLDITSNVQTGGERGLLSMAFAPDYATSGLFYVFYTAKSPLGNVRIDEFRRSASDPDAADMSTRRNVLDAPHGASNHNGGQLQFGPDGYLYATVGDNATSANAQSVASGNVYGKLLRIDPSTNAGPPDNPFAGSGDSRIFALGLRNPWRFSFDRPTGQLVIGDVGETTWEEVDLGAKGANYGWPNCEGFCVPANPSFVDPVLVYGHTASRCAIVGGYVSRADDLPSLAGRYLYGDYCTGEIRSAALATPVTDDRPEGLTVSGPVSFGEDSCGHLYTVSEGGTVSRMSEASPLPGCPPSSTPASPGPGTSPAPQPAPAGAQSDTTAPTLFARFRAHQRILRTRTLTVGAGCDEACSLVLAAKFTGTGRRTPRATLIAARAQGTAIVKYKLRVSRRGAARIRTALRHHRRVVAVVRITAKDAAGNAATPRTLRIRITG